MVRGDYEIPRGHELTRSHSSSRGASYGGGLEGLHGLATVARDTIWSLATTHDPPMHKHAFLRRSKRYGRRDLNRNGRRNDAPTRRRVVTKTRADNEPRNFFFYEYIRKEMWNDRAHDALLSSRQFFLRSIDRKIAHPRRDETFRHILFDRASRRI